MNNERVCTLSGNSPDIKEAPRVPGRTSSQHSSFLQGLTLLESCPWTRSLFTFSWGVISQAGPLIPSQTSQGRIGLTRSSGELHIKETEAPLSRRGVMKHTHQYKQCLKILHMCIQKIPIHILLDIVHLCLSEPLWEKAREAGGVVGHFLSCFL